ncbi:hypothetical protein LWI29_020437 [Acer saccharum]|uniref:Uncharacterized protein n=1 Tax=Acer saccharum TaxID=4024 RepID=A0AA39SM96_ACESA|nr:hypothetical protein LWI29_020437 [Acer saccharum]
MSYLTNGYLNTVIDWIPGMEGIRLKDLPTFIRTTDADDIKLNFAIGEVENARNASALLFNTIDDLEKEVLEALSPTYPPIFTIGPLQLLLDQIPHEDALSPIKSNLWKEQGMIKSMRASVHAREDDTDTEKEMSGNEINNFLWNLEVKIAKIIETGATLGFNFHGKENEIVEVLKRMEQEDDELLKAIVGV